MVKYCENNRGLPDAPTNMSITEDGEVATVNWDPPAVGQHSAFKLKLIPLSGTGKTVRNIVIRYN